MERALQLQAEYNAARNARGGGPALSAREIKQRQLAGTAMMLA
jgi:hypothetical protein